MKCFPFISTTATWKLDAQSNQSQGEKSYMTVYLVVYCCRLLVAFRMVDAVGLSGLPHACGSVHKPRGRPASHALPRSTRTDEVGNRNPFWQSGRSKKAVRSNCKDPTQPDKRKPSVTFVCCAKAQQSQHWAVVIKSPLQWFTLCWSALQTSLCQAGVSQPTFAQAFLRTLAI